MYDKEITKSNQSKMVKESYRELRKEGSKERGRLGKALNLYSGAER